jgi:hypothetical protein
MRHELIAAAIGTMLIVYPISVVAQVATGYGALFCRGASGTSPSEMAAAKKSSHRYDYECRAGKVKAFRCPKDDNQDECETARNKVEDICAHPEWVKECGFDYDPCRNPNAINPYEILCR